MARRSEPPVHSAQFPTAHPRPQAQNGTWGPLHRDGVDPEGQRHWPLLSRNDLVPYPQRAPQVFGQDVKEKGNEFSPLGSELLRLYNQLPQDEKEDYEARSEFLLEDGAVEGELVSLVDPVPMCNHVRQDCDGLELSTRINSKQGALVLVPSYDFQLS
ncbi:hypothetical protein BKA67DRAFT_657757 [Truncatella angustata]|uniref:Uncharacterized protein n=1 Tax=Truncatella angustata TaxID=152316 RepID=A0A9P8ZYB0_9PEZI|nr:uncharacterized protein BKA67DRAFT_657757 [Truncatella angustata]KAH6655851.1 hypothetical protein BKA67DRAFT_657757 [Truncatella angustata]